MLALFAAVIVAAASPSPSPSPNALTEIGRVSSGGRGTNLVGTATAASQGTIDQQQIANRPVMRPGELLEQIPGLIITQHSGEGKANQYYLRGFQLDHGTDLAGTIDGIPVNMPSHAHGQGYSDINWLMPETVGLVTFKKGPYYADEGDFSTAGSYDLFYRNTIPTTVALSGGSYGFDRFFAAGSPKAGAGNLLYALELFHDNGTFVRPDEYRKVNTLLRWSRTTDASAFAVTAQAYRGDFDSSDQVPVRLVDAGLLDRFGYLDPTDGGSTYRYALSTSWQHVDPKGVTRAVAYGVSYGLDLFSNFTYYRDDATDYYNVTANPITCSLSSPLCRPGPNHVSTYTSYCPANASAQPFAFACGDQREQQDKRFISGFAVGRTFIGQSGETTVGVGLRNDNIYALGLYLTNARVRWPDGTLSNDMVVERDLFAFAQTVWRANAKLRLEAGLRADSYGVRVTDFQPANSGTARQAMLNPKLTLAYAASANHELYLNLGDSFHSNDGRGTTQTVDPQTHASIDPTGAPVLQYAPLVRAWGGEIGYRYSVPKLTTTVSLWRLNIASELVFQGDGGVTTPNGPTVRKGIEVANYYRPTPALTLDADVASSYARFLTDPNGAGKYVPESLNVVTAAGITWDRPQFGASLRLRYFGPRVLDQAGTAVSSPTSLVNLQLVWKGRAGARLLFDIFNLLNAQADDVTYYYGSWLARDAANPVYAGDPAINPALGGGGVNDYHFHPTSSRTVRLTYVLPR
jgi:hypothetical protein